MKKIILFCLLFILFTKNVSANELNITPNSKSTILIDSTSHEIIYKKNENDRFAPASMTKIMSLIIIMEEIEKGNLKWNEEVETSKYAASMGGSQIYLEEGEKMTVKDLVKGICMASANDAVVSLAERLYQSEDIFVFKMNEKAKKLKLKNTHFKNSTGLDEEGHYSSAYDMAIMASELVKHKKILDFSSKFEDYLRENTDNKFWLVNTNKMVKTYKGLDGLKTGYTSNAGYCLTATAKRNDMRLIGVVMGEESSTIRNDEMKKLLDYGFNNYKVKTLYKKGEKIKEYDNREDISIVPKNDIQILNKNNTKKRTIKTKIKVFEKELPIKKGSKIGEYKIYEKNKLLYKTDLTVSKDIKKESIIYLLINNIIDLFSGNYLFN